MSDLESQFHCLACGKSAEALGTIGTQHRNHCPHCLTSKHVDEIVSGDRASGCFAAMRPVGLTFKKLGLDKYGKPRVGDVMVVHQCEGCGKVSINRIAADDDTQRLLGLLEAPAFFQEGLEILGLGDRDAVCRALFGKNDYPSVD